MRLLITGGFGYLGGRLAQYLVAKPGYYVTLGSRKKVESPLWLPDAKVVQTSLDSTDSLKKVCLDVDALVHLAGMNAQECSNNPVEAHEVNACGTGRLLEAAISQGVKRFICLSSAHVYASPLIGCITEETCPANTHPYATSHLAGEAVVLNAHQQGDIEGIVIRLSNSFGAPAHKDANCWMLLVNDLCCQAINTNRMILKSSGLQRRDFISITDACRAIAHLLKLPSENVNNNLFNVGGSWSPTLLEIAQRVASRIKFITGDNPEIITEPKQGDESPVFLDYRIKKITDTGFSLSRKSIIDEEIDQLIRFCLTHMKN